MNRIAASVGFVFGTAFLFGLGYAKRDLERMRPPDFSGLAGDSQPTAPENTVKHVYNLISEDYYLPVKATPLKYAAISGMMASLGDPHTMFLPPREKEDFEFTTTAKFVGIGCALNDDPQGIRLTDVFEDSPASKAGLKPGDVISAVDGASIVGQAREKVVNMIRGVEGTIVRLSVLRDGKGSPVVIPVKRARVFTPTVMSYYVPESKTGILSIATFSEPTVEQFDDKLSRLEKQGITGLVIDLRENPGGLLETAVGLLARFCEDKTVVRMRHRDGGEDVATTPSGFKRNLGVPIAVLINEDSASAAEIMAGVMKDYGIATLVGTHSYGKESVQNLSQMIDGAGVKVTIARYYLPVTPDFGRKVDADGQYVSGGLQPDVYVKMDPDARPVAGRPDTDVQLAKAISVLQSKGR